MTGKAPGARSAPKSKVFVIGAGLAGLSAATILAERGAKVVLIEAAGQAGGRCRSYFDSTIGGVIDNGNHLVLSGNRAVNDYRKRIGAKGSLIGPPRAEFAFADLKDGARWVLRPNEGSLPYWVTRPRRRVPGTAAADYLKYAPLLWADRKARIGDIVKDRDALWQRLMRPFLVAALNTEPEVSSAALAGAVLRETLAKGGRFYRPRIAHPVNAHFRMAGPKGAPPMLGVIGGTAEWIFAFSDRISVTVSDADAIVDQDRETLATRIWADVSKALGIDAALPPWQIVKEKRATFAATPVQDARRPGAKTQWQNLFLAGDWTGTGLPATIEGALRSGETAAALALRHLSL
jgi:hypothetical protein